MQETNKSKNLLAILISLALALVLSLVFGGLFSGRIKNMEEDRFKAAIDTAAQGNMGAEDITPQGEKGVKVYLVKSGTGGEDSYLVLSAAKSHGCQVESLVAFSYDGVISSVQLLSVKGGSFNAKALIEKSGMLAGFGGASIENESLAVNRVEGTNGCDEAVVKSVNKAIQTLKALISQEEVSE